MALPAQIRKQVKKANKLIEAANGPPVEEPKVEPPVVELVAEPPVETSPVEEPPVVVPVEPSVEPPKEDFEQKYRVLQGKYDSEVPRMSGELRAQGEQIDSLRGVIAQMQKSPEPVKPPAALVTQEEIDERKADKQAQRKLEREQTKADRQNKN